MVLTAINVTQLWAICMELEKHLNGVICTFGSRPHILHRHLLGIDLGLGFGAEGGAHCQTELSSLQGNCQEIERQGRLKMNLCQYTFLSVPLFACCMLVFVLHYVAVCACPADTEKCRCERDRPWGHLKDTHER